MRRRGGVFRQAVCWDGVWKVLSKNPSLYSIFRYKGEGGEGAGRRWRFSASGRGKAILEGAERGGRFSSGGGRFGEVRKVQRGFLVSHQVFCLG